MELWHEVEATVMIVTHSIAEATFLGDRVWIMSRGPGRIAQRLAVGIDHHPRLHGVAPRDEAA